MFTFISVRSSRIAYRKKLNWRCQSEVIRQERINQWKYQIRALLKWSGNEK